MIGEEPEIVAVVWRQSVHHHCDPVLLPDAAGGPDQAIGICGAGDHERVAWPVRQMRVQGGDRRVRSAGEYEIEM